jgi:UDP-N-acetylmuramyl tripeptide synthase
MELLDSRRLTGPNLLWDKPGSTVDVACTDAEARTLLPLWEHYVSGIMENLGWVNESLTHLKLCGGISLGISAPIDALYAASSANELAWECARAELQETPGFNRSEHIYNGLVSLKAEIKNESNPALIDLQKASDEKGLPFLWDDDAVSVGLGGGSKTWSVDALPEIEALDWDSFFSIPVGTVTGTNGKTTTVRLAQHILMHAGLNVGLSSTDWISVNNQILDYGDWSGPGGARQVLRNPTIDAAILETARGGLLRRGLGAMRVDAAVITNLSEDHLGDFGSRNLEELLNIKWLTSRAVETDGALILNADDSLLVKKSEEFKGKIVWFSLDRDNPLIVRHVANGGTALVLFGSILLRINAHGEEVICDSSEIPITMNGVARHNIANALAASALAEQLGMSLEQIRSGLTTMSQDSNPGRCNLFSIRGVSVLVDFAHNPAAIQALFDMAEALPAKRRLLAFSQPGDRPDKLIRRCARNATKIELDRVIVSELAAYHRGRKHGEVFAIIKDELIEYGIAESGILHFEEEMESLEAALEWAESGDLVIMLALGGRDSVLEKLERESCSESMAVR